MATMQVERSWRGRRGGSAAAILFCCALGLLPLGCGGGGDDDGVQPQADEQLLAAALPNFGPFTPVRLNTAALAKAVRAGRAIRLPFGKQGGGTVQLTLRLTLRNLRAPDLTSIVLKDGDAGSGSTIPLPPPSTYQGTVQGGGVAVFTVTDAAIEGSMLVAPEGWSFIEPLEPQLRFNGVDPDIQRRLLKKYNHIVYNARDSLGDNAPLNDYSGPPPGPAPSPPPPAPLVLSIVADGDAALFRAYPLDSVMPFWLKQETILNSVDWLYNCVEPDANSDNAYARCDNDFDGGSNKFQARLRIDRLEVWTSGGPDSPLRGGLLQQSISMTHQASPPCCGPPHTAGQSNLVHFFSGADLDAPGLAAERGVNYYGPLCFVTDVTFRCHHGLSQIVPGHAFRGTAFHQHVLVAHEIGHNNGAHEAFAGDYTCWLFNEQCGGSVMNSTPSFSGNNLYVYTEDDAARMGELMAEQLGSAPGNP
jgi:hypothetical protein